jgi:putative mRNA 3-end processing factor
MTIRIGDYNIALDKKEKNANLSFISHAHTDHTGWSKGHIKTLTSSETAMIIKARDKIDLDYINSIEKTELLDAGHILGSKQLRVETSEKVITYSGDFQMQESNVAPKIKIKPADTVIIDSTYTDPNINFENREETVYTMQKYIKTKLEKGTILFGAYPLGKSQEIIKICNEIGVVPLVNQKAGIISKIYNEFGAKLEYISFAESQEEYMKLMEKNFVGIIENGRLDMVKDKLSIKLDKKIFTAVATGFAEFTRFNTDVQFGLSDHADFKQATEYIDACNAKLVYTKGNESKLFAHNLSKKGYNALPYSEFVSI